MNEEEINGLYDDNGNKINPDLLVRKPGLCLLCKKDEVGDKIENMLCVLNRFDQQGKDDFECGAL